MIFSLTNPHLFIAIAISVINGIVMCLDGYKFLQIIQLSGYKIGGYRVWLREARGKWLSRVSMLAFLSFACMLVTNSVIDGFEPNFYASYVGLAFYFVFSIVYIKNIFIAPKKTPLKATRRMSRLIGMLFILSISISFGFILLGWKIPYIRYSAISATPLILPLIVPLAHFLVLPFENLNRIKYIEWSKSKLRKQENLIRIGITGSYGKTSTKYILNSILSKKYQVCISPYSFNTPMGLSKVIWDYLKPEHEVFIAEMGARQLGDIKFLCDMVNPKFAILTAVGEQHLATFSSLENVKKTKKELIDSLPIEDGFAVFNADDEISMQIRGESKVKNQICSIKDETTYCHAKDVSLSKKGMTFTLCIGDQTRPCSSTLLGEHNLQNILLCATMADKLGLTIDEIGEGISELKPVAHRLELTRANDINILDDSYNSSPKGSKSALKTLSMFDDDGPKIVITPGIIELGEKEFEANKEFGKDISKVADFCIIVNDANKDAILAGLEEGGFDKTKIFTVPSLEHAKVQLKDIVKPNATVLFENDLPDNYF